MKEFKHETVVTTRQGWEHLEKCYREKVGCKIPSPEFLERSWKRAFRNLGANPATHPIEENEIRVEHGSFCMTIEEIKSALTRGKFDFRQDGFVAEGFNL